MKTKSLFIAALVLVSAVISAVGKDEPSKAGLAIMPVKGSEVFKVIYKGENAGRVKLSLYNASKDVVFTEYFSNVSGFIRPLNFKGLAFGEYTVELVDATGKREEKIKYTSNLPVIRVAKLSSEEGKFLLAIANPTSNTLSVRIFNGANELLHSETKSDVSGDFAKVFKVTNTKEVVFEVSDSNGNTQVVRF